MSHIPGPISNYEFYQRIGQGNVGHPVAYFHSLICMNKWGKDYGPTCRSYGSLPKQEIPAIKKNLLKVGKLRERQGAEK